MKTGTWKCWLFGHKFVEDVWRDGSPNILKAYVMSDEKVWESRQTNHCVRCGIERN